MLDHLADLESDFSRFHRIDDIYSLDGPRFMRLAWRVSCYGGVIAMRIEAQWPHRNGQPVARTQRASAHGDAKTQDLTALMAQCPGVIERVKTSG